MIKKFINILVAPNKVYAEIKDRPRWFLPWLYIPLYNSDDWQEPFLERNL